MELTNEFEIDLPIDEAFDTLTDLELVAPCMPGAQLTEVEGDSYRGMVKVKVGPITANYAGEATFVEHDRAAHKATVKADGRETKGQGNANAVVTMTMDELSAAATKVQIHTDLKLTGKVAQFGRGVISDVSAKLLGQFTDNLESTVLTKEAAGQSAEPSPGSSGATPSTTTSSDATPLSATPTASDATTADATTVSPAEGADTLGTSGGPAGSGGTTASTNGVRKITGPAAEPVDLLDAAGGSVAKRAVPAGIALLILLWIIRKVLSSRDGE